MRTCGTMNMSPQASLSVLKKKCVTKRGGEWFYPPTIARKRGIHGVIFQIVLICVFFILAILFSKHGIWHVMWLFTTIHICMLAGEYLKRCTQLFEEFYSHIPSRYGNSKIEAVYTAFSFQTLAVPYPILILISLFFLGLATGNISVNLTDKTECGTLGCLLISWYLLKNIIKWEASPLNDSLWIESSNGLDFGSGMAHSFFHGYLNLMLPKTGNEEKDLKESMIDFEDKHDVKFMEYKLFILIPKSGNCHVSLQNDFSPSVESCKSLEEKIKTVAGVRDRVYKNSVYKIKKRDSNEKIYVCAEYATPIKTFNDVRKGSGKHSKHYRKRQNDIILQFFLTLSDILVENNLSHLCEPIFFDDQDEQGQFYDIGEIILARLKEIKKYQ